MPTAKPLRLGDPAAAVVSADTTIVLEFRAVPAGGTLEGRTVGEVRLPLEHVAKRCGHCLYYTWFPLNAPWPQRAQGGNGPAAGSQAGQGD